MEPWEKIIGEISRQRENLKETLTIEKRLGIIEIVRHVDFVFVITSYLTSKMPKEEKENWQEIFFRRTAGYYDALFLFMDESVKNPGYPLIPSKKNIQEWVEMCLDILGSAASITRFLELSKLGVVTLKEEDENKFRFLISKDNSGYEFIDKIDIEWVRDLRVRKSAMPLEKGIQKLISDNVRVWNGHYIAYGSTPELDSYYAKKGRLYTTWLDGSADFPDTAKFNGIPYAKYKLVLSSLIALNLKHLDFSLVLWSKNVASGLNLRNIVTIPERLSDLSQSIAEYYNLNLSEVSSIIDVLTYKLEDASLFKDLTGGPAAPLIAIADDLALRSLAGALSNPYFYLFRKLKHYFKQDYENAIKSREDIFRQELNKAFRSLNILKYDKALPLKNELGLATDVDAVLFDKKNSSVALFQLKWMETFGNSMRERNSRADNFTEKSKKWIDAVLLWLEKNGHDGLTKRLEAFLPAGSKVKTVYLFILGRYYSFFSGESFDDRAVWTSWSRIVRLEEEKPHRLENLKVFNDALLKLSDISGLIGDVEKKVIKLGELEIIITNIPDQ